MNRFGSPTFVPKPGKSPGYDGYPPQGLSEARRTGDYNFFGYSPD